MKTQFEKCDTDDLNNQTLLWEPPPTSDNLFFSLILGQTEQCKLLVISLEYILKGVQNLPLIFFSCQNVV